jgi:streptogramin lyase
MGSAGTSAAGGSGCVASGRGHIQVRVHGLPEGVPANLVVGGPIESLAVTADRTLDVAAGPYVITTGPVAAPDPIVRTLFTDVLDETEFCLVDGATHSVEVEYVQVATSHALWTTGADGDADLLAFAASTLTASAQVAPSISARAGTGKDITFDVSGNLWSMGATLAEPHLLRFPREAFVGSGDQDADRRIDIEGVECLPAVRAFAFDAEGSLWVSTCGGRVVALAPSALAASGSVEPARSVSGLSDNGDLAFDIQRNLWVTDGDAIVRYDAARLSESIDGGPDLRSTLVSALGGPAIVPSNLAFDGAGNLWVIDFGGNLLAKIASADLEAVGTRSTRAETTLTLAVSALLERPAFDESSGLWIALDQGRFGRLSEVQLATGSSAGAPTLPGTVISSPTMGYANRMALFPAPADLPLYHRFP